jgi:hypothetical protein
MANRFQTVLLEFTETSFGRTESDGFESRNLLDKQISDCITGILYLDSSLAFNVDTHSVQSLHQASEISVT